MRPPALLLVFAVLAGFLFRSNLRDPQYMDLYEWGIGKDRAELLWKASGRLELPIVSRDHALFAIVEVVSDADQNVWSKVENRLRAFRATDRFLDRYVYGDTTIEVGERGPR
jgi:hypothetical protein